MDSLRSLALDLQLPERTLRRAARQGLVRGERTSERKFQTTVREREYLRRNWPLLSRLRKLLRTEPNVRLAVLYGSHARGSAGPDSDVDLMVDLRRADAGQLADLSGRLTRAVGRDVQLLRLRDARVRPSVFVDVLDQGRVLIDRERKWESLREERGQAREQAATQPSLSELASEVESLELS